MQLKSSTRKYLELRKELLPKWEARVPEYPWGCTTPHTGAGTGGSNQGGRAGLQEPQGWLQICLQRVIAPYLERSEFREKGRLARGASTGAAQTYQLAPPTAPQAPSPEQGTNFNPNQQDWGTMRTSGFGTGGSVFLSLFILVLF